MKKLSYSFNLARATIRIRLTKAQYKTILAHFGQTDQLRLPSGEAFCQGNGWYEVHLNDVSFLPQIAAQRFYGCIIAGLFASETVAKSKQVIQERTKAIQVLHSTTPRHFHPVDVIHSHGRTISVVRSRLASALANKDSEIASDIRKLMDAATPASYASVQNLAHHFGH
jgi:hypothetical protein